MSEAYVDVDDELETDEQPELMTARDLLHAVAAFAPSMDSVVSCSIENGGTTVHFPIVGVFNLDEDEEPGNLILVLGTPRAWDTSNGEDKGAGVLVLEDE